MKKAWIYGLGVALAAGNCSPVKGFNSQSDFKWVIQSVF